MNLREPRSFFAFLLAVVFTVLIFLPGALMLFTKGQSYSETEKRMLAEFPPLPQSPGQLGTFQKGLASYLSDHFGLREFLVYRYQREIRKRFKVIGSEVDVLKGLDNYYYYTGFRMLDDWLGRIVLSPQDLQAWEEHYRAKEKWLAERGIAYLLVVAPAKYSIYPEKVAIEWQEIRGKSRLQQLNAHLDQEKRPGFFLDLSPYLLAEKAGEYLYHKSDTHWAPFGAYQGYLAMAQAIEARIFGIDFRKDFTFTREVTRDCSPKGNRCGDLTQMLLDFEPFSEPFKVVDRYPRCNSQKPVDLPLSNLKVSLEPANIESLCSGKKYTALVFHDSFMLSIRPFLSENFARIIYLWKLYDQKNMEEILRIYKPDIVIEERFERKLFEGI